MLKFQQRKKKVKKYLEILKKCRLFDLISEKDLEHTLACLGARVEVFEKHYTVFAEGTPARHLGIVLSGSVQLYRMDYFGNRSILSEAGPSEIFGEAFACAETDSLPVSAVATSDSEIMLIDRDRILHVCSNSCLFHQQIIYNIMKDLAQKTIAFHQRIEVTSRRSTREKLLAYLNIQARRRGSPSFEIPFDRQELADYLEVDRSGLSAEISKLRREGILENVKNRFVLLEGSAQTL
jgi:CRP-like cAMP-binding protein